MNWSPLSLNLCTIYTQFQNSICLEQEWPTIFSSNGLCRRDANLISIYYQFSSFMWKEWTLTCSLENKNLLVHDEGANECTRVVRLFKLDTSLWFSFAFAIVLQRNHDFLCSVSILRWNSQPAFLQPFNQLDSNPFLLTLTMDQRLVDDWSTLVLSQLK